MEEEKTLSEEALGFGFNKAKSRFGFFAMYLIAWGLVFLVFMGATVGLLFLEGGLKALAAFPYLILCVLGLSFGLMSLKLSLIVNKGERPSFSGLWPGTGKAVRFLVGCIIYGVIVGIGFLLLIIPGIYLAIKLQFFGLCIVDEDARPMEAIKKSSEMTKGHWGDCFVLVFEQGLLVGLGGLFTLGIGLFWFIPAALVAHGYGYMKLSGQLAPAAQPAAAPAAVPAQ